MTTKVENKQSDRAIELLRGAARTAFAVPWTALVTASAVSIAKVTGEHSWVLRGERLWAEGLLRAWQVDVNVEFAEPLDTSRPYVVMANHSSHLDVPILFLALPVIPGFLAKAELNRVPFLSMALRSGGHVLLDRSDRASAMRALKKAALHVREGTTIAVFPEGTRGNGESLSHFKKGGFVIARHARASILPVGIRGSAHVLPRGSAVPRTGRVTVHVGSPISSTRHSTEELIGLVQSRIAALSGLAVESSFASRKEDTARIGPGAGEVLAVASADRSR